MTVHDSASAEEFYSRCLSHARVLHTASQRYAAEDAAIPALAAAWGGDVFATQAVVWERINVASRAPQRRFFEVAGQLTLGIAGLAPSSPDTQTAYDVVLTARQGLLEACEPSLRHRLESVWPPIDFLDALPAPTDDDFDEWVLHRLEGVSPAEYVVRKRREAQETMVKAQELRIRNEITGAVHGAYASDMQSLDSYLVESAVAAGDDYLITVPIRWETATHAVAQLTGLPSGFTPALESIRQALCAGLGDAEGHRLRSVFVPV